MKSYSGRYGYDLVEFGNYIISSKILPNLNLQIHHFDPTQPSFLKKYTTERKCLLNKEGEE